LGVLWLLTRQPGPRRRSLMIWWPVFTGLATLWWLVPLFVMGAYSPPFLDFIETASVTTFPTTLFDALRGTSAWVPYVDPSWQGGNEVITRFYLALNSGVVLMLGLAGMLRSSTPHRQFLLSGVLLGLVLVTMGHQGAVQGWFAGPLNGLLDGALAPFRNVHKFDLVVRLPMVLGLAWLVEAAVRARRDETVTLGARSLRVPSHLGVVALTVLGVVGAAVPAVTGKLAPTDPVLETAEHWRETTGWLSENSGDTVALLAPGSGFADYVWGSPRDEPVQYLGESRWAVRNAIPLAPPGNIRMLDAFERRLAQGRGSPGLADFLRRAGVRHLVVRNDLQRSNDVPGPVLVHQALEQSPGLRKVESFGADLGGGASIRNGRGRLLVDGGWQSVYPAVEVYRVLGTSPAVSSDGLPVVVGGPEDLLDLADTGVLGSQPTRLAVDAQGEAAPTAGLVLTDGMLDRERFFGRVHDGASAVTTPGDVRRSGNPTKDYALGTGDRWLTTARLLGARAVSASSSASDANAAGGARPGRLPYAAIDGDGTTEWVAGAGETPWWQLDLREPTRVEQVQVLAGEGVLGRQRLRVSTEGERSRVVTLDPGESDRVDLDGGPTSWVRVEGIGAGTGRLALAEVRVDDLELTGGRRTGSCCVRCLTAARVASGSVCGCRAWRAARWPMRSPAGSTASSI
jgi:arabinofuranan 3-O-arabinosyltransferase